MKNLKKQQNGTSGPKAGGAEEEQPANADVEREIKGLTSLSSEEFDRKFEKMLVRMKHFFFLRLAF